MSPEKAHWLKIRPSEITLAIIMQTTQLFHAIWTKLKFEDGDIESAYKYSKDALKQCGNVPNYTVLVTSAEIANAHKEYAQAASLYFKSTNTGIINRC